ncbi:MAG: FMN-binding protein [Vicinamibacteria bacterium]
MNLKFTFILIGMLALSSPRLPAEVLLTESAALARAFPGVVPERRTLYLTEAQVAAIEKAARSKMPSAVVTTFLARSTDGDAVHAVLDTQIVRTMPETVMTVVEPDGRLRMALVLQFGEPPDYLPQEGWLKTLGGKSLDDELSPGRGVRRVTGATLTVQALTDAVRRSMALDALVLRGKP